MESLVGLFDSLLTLVVTFPITIYYVLISPDKLANTTGSAMLSSPGTTLFISFLIWYTANSLELKIKYALKLPRLPSKSFLVQVILVLLVVLCVQYYYLVLTYFGPSSAEEAIRIIKALSYPLSVFLTIYGVVYVVYILLPLGSSVHGYSLQERFDMNFRSARRKFGNKRIVIDEDASFLATVFGLLAYVYALYQVLRVFFDMLQGTALVHTAGLIFASVMLLAAVLNLALDRFKNLADRRRSERKSMPKKDP